MVNSYEQQSWSIFKTGTVSQKIVLTALNNPIDKLYNEDLLLAFSWLLETLQNWEKKLFANLKNIVRPIESWTSVNQY